VNWDSNILIGKKKYLNKLIAMKCVVPAINTWKEKGALCTKSQKTWNGYNSNLVIIVDNQLSIAFLVVTLFFYIFFLFLRVTEYRAAAIVTSGITSATHAGWAFNTGNVRLRVTQITFLVTQHLTAILFSPAVIATVRRVAVRRCVTRVYRGGRSTTR